MSTLPRCFFAINKKKMLTVLSFRRSAVTRFESKAVVTETFDPDKPIKFSTSGAGWNYKIDQTEGIINYPWYKEVILWGTFLFFVHYFMFFRQPNDIDEELDMPLGKRLLLIQESNLLEEKQRLLRSGNSASTVDNDLEKLNELRKKYNYI